ncbi:hypothetical protein ACFQS4_03850 [Saliphagus sp. GCM10025317]
MSESIEVQRTIIGLGLLLAVLVLGYGAVVSETVLGIDATTAAMWVLAGTFAVSSIVHAWIGQYGFALGHAGGAFGWGAVLLGSSAAEVGIGLVLLVLSGVYLALMGRRGARTDAAST